MLKFKVNRTYSEVTPESAEHGDFSDTGFVSQDEIYTLRELIDLIKRDCFYREGKGTNWFETDYWTECYRTATERSESLHIELLTKTETKD